MKPHHYQVLIASCVAVTLGLLWTGTSQPGSTLAPGLYPSARHTPPEPFAEDSGRGSPQATTRPTAVACESTGFTGYETLPAYQWDQDNPVRPAWYHADKNLALRGYAPAPGSDLLRLVDYGTDDPTQPPQLATLFDPPRVPVFVGAYRVGG